MVIFQLLVVLVAIVIGARIGGIGLGIMGGLGLGILTFVFGLQPTSPPIDVMLMIAAVVTAAATMQASGGVALMVKIAEKILRKNPQHITFFSPIVTYIFTFAAGTGHVAYSLLPVIAEVATEAKIRPERPLGIAVIASQQAITASPISAATVALLGLLAGFDVTLLSIMAITVPATLIGVLVASFFSLKIGKDLEKDPEYLRRVANGEISTSGVKTEEVKNKKIAIMSIVLFLVGTVFIVLMGSLEWLRPSFNVNNEIIRLGMSHIIEIVMFCAAGIMVLVGKIKGTDISKGNIFGAGMQALIAIFGIAWMGDTFISGNMEFFKGGIENMVTNAPWLFAVALFVTSILVNSQASTVRMIMPLGLILGINPVMLIALFPAVNGYFFVPNYPTLVAAMQFDRTGTTRIGKYVLNHSFMQPGLIATLVAVSSGILISKIFF